MGAFVGVGAGTGDDVGLGVFGLGVAAGLGGCEGDVGPASHKLS